MDRLLVCAKKGKITNTLTCTHVGPDRILFANGLCHITCDAWVYSESQEDADDILYSAPCIVDFSKNMRELLFKPADIEALAKKMNETAEQQQDASELDYLRRELEAAKDRALTKHSTIRQMEAELSELRKQLEQEYRVRLISVDEALGLKDELEQERAAQVSAKLRVEKAEAIANELNQRFEQISASHQHKVQFLYDRLKEERSDRTAAEKRAELAEAEARPSHLLAISSLLELLGEPGRTGRNQAGVITEILGRYPKKRGLSKRNLEDMFAAANKAKEEAE